MAAKLAARRKPENWLWLMWSRGSQRGKWNRSTSWEVWTLRLYRVQTAQPAIAKIIRPEVAPTSFTRGFILFTLAISWLCSVALDEEDSSMKSWSSSCLVRSRRVQKLDRHQRIDRGLIRRETCAKKESAILSQPETIDTLHPQIRGVRRRWM